MDTATLNWAEEFEQHWNLLRQEDTIMARAVAKKKRGRGSEGERGRAKVRRGPGSGENGESYSPRPSVSPSPPLSISPSPVPVESIDPNPFQARKHFAAERIADLARSIEAEGLLQAPTMRPTPDGRFELAFGERRFRAVQSLGWKEIPATVRELTDADMRRLAAQENAQREDIDPIERAAEWKRLLEEGDYATQAELGAAFGVTQGQVSNTIRLLDLPKKAKDLVISGEIPAAHARRLVPLAKYGPVIDEVVREVAARGAGTVDEFREMVEEAVFSAGRELGPTWDPKHGSVPAMDLDQRQLTELDVVEVEGYGGRKHQVAMNAKLYDKLCAEHVALLPNGKGKKGRTQARVVKKGGDQEPVKPTAAELKAKAKERERVYQKRLLQWFADWQRWLLAEWFRTQASVDDCLKLLLMVDVCWERGYQYDRADAMKAVLAKFGVKVTGDRYSRDLAGPLAGLDEPTTADVAAEFCRGVFWIGDPSRKPRKGRDDNQGPNQHIVGNYDACLLAESWRIDYESAWLDEQAGPMSESFWNLHTTAQLVALCDELLGGACTAERDFASAPYQKMKKGELVQLLLAKKPAADQVEAGLPLPKCLAGINRKKLVKAAAWR